MKIANTTDIDPIWNALMDYYDERNWRMAVILGILYTYMAIPVIICFCYIIYKCCTRCAEVRENSDRAAPAEQRV